MIKLNNDFSSYIKSKGANYDKIDRNNRKFIYNNSHLFNVDDYLSSGNIFDKLLNERVIFLGEIDDVNIESIKASLLYLDHINNDDITIYINSGGGSVYSGLGLIDIMDYIDSDVSTINTGLAASMAAVVLCSGKKGKRKSLKRSRTMIHQPSTYLGYSQASDLEIDAKEVNFLKKDLYTILSQTTGQSYKKVYTDSERDYWMSAEDAKEYGIIDKVIGKKK